MIIISPDVTRDGSNIPYLPDAVISPILEAITGADVMISKLDIPAGKEALLREHIVNRALLVQVKVGADYPSSFGNRLHMSQAKMKEAGASPQQRWLVTVGVYTKTPDGELAINSAPASKMIPGQRYTFKAANTASRSWQLRGGCYHNCYNGERFVEWVVEAEEWLKSKQPEVVTAMPDVGEIEVEDNDPFQMVQRVTDGRVALSALIGPALAQALWEQSSKSTAWALDFLTDPSPTRKVKGIGDGIKQKARNKLGLGKGEKLEVTTVLSSGDGDY